MRRSKKALAVLLSVLMLCGMLPFSIFADANEGAPETNVGEDVNTEVGEENGADEGETTETYTVKVVVYTGMSPKTPIECFTTENKISVGESYVLDPNSYLNAVCWTYCGSGKIQKYDAENEKYVAVALGDDGKLTVTEAGTYAIKYKATDTHNGGVAEVSAVPATCYRDGSTEGIECKECKFTTVKIDPKKEHDLQECDAVDATCAAEGHTAGSYCKNEGCNEHTYTVIQKLPHTYDHPEEYSIAASGAITYHCSACESDVTTAMAYGFGSSEVVYDGEGYTYKDTRNAWREIRGSFYYFDNNGHIVLDGSSYSSEYEFTILGKLLNGTVEAKDNKDVAHFYKCVDGAILKSTEGPVRVGMKLYEFDANGYGTQSTQAAGWVTSGEESYYLCESGKLLRSGWVEKDGKLYYFGKECKMATGEYVISGVTYTFGSDGSLQTASGKVTKANGTTAYVTETGKLARSSWVQIDGDWYYFNRDNEMVTGSFVIDGATYEFGADGVCQNYEG